MGERFYEPPINGRLPVILPCSLFLLTWKGSDCHEHIFRNIRVCRHCSCGDLHDDDVGEQAADIQYMRCDHQRRLFNNLSSISYRSFERLPYRDKRFSAHTQQYKIKCKNKNTTRINSSSIEYNTVLKTIQRRKS